MRAFASDNNAGVHPGILQALAEANHGHAVGYGADAWTERLDKAFESLFAAEVKAYPVLTGTGANVLSLSALLGPYDAVLCSEISHLYVDECGAPERFLGAKLIPLPAHNGKLQFSDLPGALQDPEDEHRIQPRVISITQPTEVGTLYSLNEIRQLAEFAHAHQMYLHVDGARIANAVIALQSSFAQMLLETGVDVLSFGGTKNGLLCGEAVVFLKPELAKRFKFLRKQGMQLLSKMRFISAQLEAYLSQGIWAQNAEHANQMARLLAEELAPLGRLHPEIELAFPVQSNAVFVKLPPELIAPLQERYFFYVWQTSASIVRWMTSFDTQPEEIHGLIAALKELLAERKAL